MAKRHKGRLELSWVDKGDIEDEHWRRALYSRDSRRPLHEQSPWSLPLSLVNSL